MKSATMILEKDAGNANTANARGQTETELGRPSRLAHRNFEDSINVLFVEPLPIRMATAGTGDDLCRSGADVLEGASRFGEAACLSNVRSSSVFIVW
jgi:hypothetical protein